MKRILVSKSQTLLMGHSLALAGVTWTVLGLGAGVAIFSMADAWMRLPMIGTAAVILAYKRTF